MTNRAESLGLSKAAREIETSWSEIAGSLKIAEDYFGFYSPEFLTVIQQKIDYMLVEADPRQYVEAEAGETENMGENDSPIKLLNSAWKRFYSNATGYNVWENDAISRWLNAA